MSYINKIIMILLRNDFVGNPAAIDVSGNTRINGGLFALPISVAFDSDLDSADNNGATSMSLKVKWPCIRQR